MENVERLRGLMSDIGLDWIALSGADSVCFATGHEVPIETGQSPFAGGPTIALIGRDASVGIACSNVEGVQVPAAQYEPYLGFDCAVTDYGANYYSAVQKLIKKLGVSGVIGFERVTFPAMLSDLFVHGLRPVDGELARLRAVKTAAELEKLRHCARVAAIGQEAARAHSAPGRAELEVFGKIRYAMEKEADTRCPVAGEYLTGIERTLVFGLQPSRRLMGAGDPVLCDLAPRVAGYWGDSCGSFVIGGQPDKSYAAMFRAAKDTLEFAISEIRPGLRANEFDAMLRQHMKSQGYSYPHHSGHGIGTSVHEFPRLVPDEDATLEENMVLMIEPGSYLAGIGGIRCEFMLRLSATGSEIMAPFTMSH